MKTILIILLVLHGLAHLIGFSKAYWLLEVRTPGNITRSVGMAWLMSGLSLLTTAFLFGFDHKYWWLMGFISAIASQALIFSAWKETKAGSFLNLLIFIFSVLAMIA